MKCNRYIQTVFDDVPVVQGIKTYVLERKEIVPAWVVCKCGRSYISYTNTKLPSEYSNIQTYFLNTQIVGRIECIIDRSELIDLPFHPWLQARAFKNMIH